MDFRLFRKIVIFDHFVFYLFSVCRTFEFDRNFYSCQIRYVWIAFRRADFCQAFLKISARSVTSRPSYSVFIECHLFKWQKCSFWRIKVTFTFLFLFAVACCAYLPIGIIDWMLTLSLNCTLIVCNLLTKFLVAIVATIALNLGLRKLLYFKC